MFTSKSLLFPTSFTKNTTITLYFIDEEMEQIKIKAFIVRLQSNMWGSCPLTLHAGQPGRGLIFTWRLLVSLSFPFSLCLSGPLFGKTREYFIGLLDFKTRHKFGIRGGAWESVIYLLVRLIRGNFCCAEDSVTWFSLFSIKCIRASYQHSTGSLVS